MNSIEKIFGKIGIVLHYVACVCFMGLLLLVLASITTRYLFDSPFNFTEEVVGLLVITMVMASVPLVSHQGKHINVTMLSVHFRGWFKFGASIFTSLVTLAFTGWFAYASLEWFEFAYRLNIKTSVTSIPLPPFMSLIPLIMTLLALMAVWDLVKKIMGACNKNSQKTQQSTN